MKASPQVHIDLNKVLHNAFKLAQKSQSPQIRFLPVLKLFQSHPMAIHILKLAGFQHFGDSRLSRLKKLATRWPRLCLHLLRPSLPEEAEEIVRTCTLSHQSSFLSCQALSTACQKLQKKHQIILMLECGDLREGMPWEIAHDCIPKIRRLPGLQLVGLGTNLSCLNGIHPQKDNLHALIQQMSSLFGENQKPGVLSIGNSSQLEWMNQNFPTIHQIEFRLGEALLLGQNPKTQSPIPDFFPDAVEVHLPILERYTKPRKAFGGLPGANAFGEKAPLSRRTGSHTRLLIPLGWQDCDPYGWHLPPGLRLEGACSDSMILSCDSDFPTSEPLILRPRYRTLMGLMQSPEVTRIWKGGDIDLQDTLREDNPPRS